MPANGQFRLFRHPFLAITLFTLFQLKLFAFHKRAVTLHLTDHITYC